MELFAGGLASMSTALQDHHGVAVGWTAELCSDRRAINQLRFDEADHYGDVTLDEWDVPRDYNVDVVSASFPCTPYSAGGRH